MSVTDFSLQKMIDRLARENPEPGGSFHEILCYLRELQRRRASVPKLADNLDWRVDYDARCRNSYARGWNACVEAMEKAVNNA